MNRKFRRELFKRFKKVKPDAQATRCFTGFMYDFSDSGYTYASALDIRYRERLRIFQIGECDWIAAISLKEARECHMKYSFGESQSAREEHDECYPEDECFELSDEKLDSFRFNDEDQPDEEISFRDQLNKLISDGEKFPTFFASSEY